MKIFLALVFSMTALGCDTQQNEFIPLDHLTFTNSYAKNSVKVSYYVLIDHPSPDGGTLKNEIIRYVKRRLDDGQPADAPRAASLNFVFYEKTGQTAYFIAHKEDPGGLASEEISHHREDYIANYAVRHCEGGVTEKLYLHDGPEETLLDSCS